MQLLCCSSKWSPITCLLTTSCMNQCTLNREALQRVGAPGANKSEPSRSAEEPPQRPKSGKPMPRLRCCAGVLGWLCSYLCKPSPQSRTGGVRKKSSYACVVRVQKLQHMRSLPGPQHAAHHIRFLRQQLQAAEAEPGLWNPHDTCRELEAILRQRDISERASGSRPFGSVPNASAAKRKRRRSSKCKHGKGHQCCSRAGWKGKHCTAF